MSREPVVISASRRTDLAACFPEVLFSRLQEFSRETVHSVVIWTKNPRNLMAPGPLRELLKEHGQIYVHLTITGMGGSEFEPHVPPWQEVAAMAGPLIALIGGPQRLCWRFDPILEVRGGGRSFSNFSLFPSLAETLALWGIQDCRVSWVSPYKKVGRRLRAAGWELSAAPESRKAQGEILARTARDHGIDLQFCSMEGFPISRCIDGGHLSEIHPERLPASTRKAGGQRPLCGCTRSLDIGWYSLACHHECLYCYARP